MFAAAAVVMLWIHHASNVPVAAPVPAPEHGPAVMLAVDAGTGSATTIPADAAAPGWTDMLGLLAGLERAQRAAIARCRSDDAYTMQQQLATTGAAHARATFRIQRRPDGSSPSFLVIHHSLGYLGYSQEEDCLQKVAQSFELPPLPPPLWSVAFTLAPPPSPSSSPSSGSAWIDPARAGEELIAPVRTRVEACVHDAHVPHAQEAKVVFEPGARGARQQDRALARARIVLDDRLTGEVMKCIARVEDIAVPALPEPVDDIMLALTLPP